MDSVLNRIRVNLYPNLLTEDPNDLSAKVISERTLSVQDICRTAVNRAKAPTTPEAMEHNVGLFLKEMAYQLMNGFAINTGYFTASAQVRGVFNNSRETFDPRKHSILFRFNQGDLLRKEIPNVTVQIMGLGESGIIISHVVDHKTGSVNDLLTPGGTLKIRGGKLRIAGDHIDVGVSFEDEAGNAVKVAEQDIIVNNPSELIVEIPALIPGKYKLVINSQYTGSSTLLKDVRTAVYEKLFTVQ
jgi:hypothetical protein